MEYLKFDNYDSLSNSIADDLINLVKSKSNRVICLPSGDSPKGVFWRLCKYEEEHIGFFANTVFVGLDEWLGMNRDDEGSCQYHIFNDILSKINFKKVIEFNAKAENPEKECISMDKMIKELGGIDYMLLGVGVNGHLGLNEPNSSFENYSWVCDLSKTTKEVAQKYFSNKTSLDRGITLGIKSILETKKVVVIACGERKKDIISVLKNTGISEEIPISALKLHTNSYIYTDF